MGVSPRSVARAGGRGLVLFTGLVLAAGLLSTTPYGAQGEALDALSEAGSGSAGVRSVTTGGRLDLLPTGPRSGTGFVFQPGALVDHRAYTATLAPLARAGHVVSVVKQPFHLAFTATDAPSAAMAAHPEVSAWAVGGHSLGGVFAAEYAAAHPDEVAGLLLWASYPARDLSAVDLSVTTVAAGADALATPAEVEASLSDLPDDSTLVVLEGMSHAQFGDYGPQRGDGVPAVPDDEARAGVVEASLALLDGLSPAVADAP